MTAPPEGHRGSLLFSAWLLILKEGHLVVDRGSADSRVESARSMARALEAGTSLLVFPEGTRAAGHG